MDIDIDLDRGFRAGFRAYSGESHGNKMQHEIEAGVVLGFMGIITHIHVLDSL